MNSNDIKRIQKNLKEQKNSRKFKRIQMIRMHPRAAIPGKQHSIILKALSPNVNVKISLFFFSHGGWKKIKKRHFSCKRRNRFFQFFQFMFQSYTSNFFSKISKLSTSIYFFLELIGVEHNDFKKFKISTNSQINFENKFVEVENFRIFFQLKLEVSL